MYRTFIDLCLFGEIQVKFAISDLKIKIKP